MKKIKIQPLRNSKTKNLTKLFGGGGIIKPLLNFKEKYEKEEYYDHCN